MLSTFDWIRRCRSGAELLATLEYFRERESDSFPEHKALAGPVSLFNRPCKRCWLYPCGGGDGLAYCRTCLDIVAAAKVMGHKSKRAVVVWGHVDHLPKQLESGRGFRDSGLLGSYIHDERHFMLLLQRYKLKQWMQELLLYHGSNLKGLLQIFPTTGETAKGNMVDIVNRAVHHDARYPMDLLRIRFFSNPFQLFAAHKRDDAGLLTFEAGKFVELLQMAHVFRSLLGPEEQQLVRELMNLGNSTEERLQWGRFAGCLPSEAREMLSSWNIRQWSKNQIALLYELLEYVEYAS